MDNIYVTKSRLLEHIFGTYNWLRFGMAITAFAFPILLWAWGRWYGLDLQGSMSAYYWASIEGDPPVRIWFVGIIFAIGSFLLLYKGYTIAEDLTLNGAAVLLILVALFPMSWKCGSEFGFCQRPYLHSGFAIAFFACIVYVALFQSGKTLDETTGGTPLREVYRYAYWATRASLVIFPLAAIIAHLLTRNWDKLTYWLELAGIWAFAFFWLVKSFELWQAEKPVRQAVVGLSPPSSYSRHRLLRLRRQ